jgi:hypothetical protein
MMCSSIDSSEARMPPSSGRKSKLKEATAISKTSNRLHGVTYQTKLVWELGK